MIPNYVTIEVGNAESDNSVASFDITFENGQAILGDKPGLGIEINHEELAKASGRQNSARCRPEPLRTSSWRRTL